MNWDSERSLSRSMVTQPLTVKLGFQPNLTPQPVVFVMWLSGRELRQGSEPGSTFHAGLLPDLGGDFKLSKTNKTETAKWKNRTASIVVFVVLKEIGILQMILKEQYRLASKAPLHLL